MSPSGKRVVLSDGRLRDLSEIERKILHRVAIEKINQLNIGVNVTVPGGKIKIVFYLINLNYYFFFRYLKFHIV